mgnify:CR=1 FL=1
MPYYVNSHSFGAITSSGGSATADADRRIQGRCYLVGFSLVPIYTTSTSTYSVNTNGTIKLEDLNSARTTTSGTVVVQFPVVSQLQYPSITYCSLSDDDGGVLFENGIYLNDTTNLGGASNTDNPLKNFSLTIFYTGPEFSDYS